MRAWWELYKKEFTNNLFLIAVTLLILLLWQIFLFTRVGNWPNGLLFGLSFFPFQFYPLLVLYMGYNAYKQEWKDDTNYFLLSLPRYGWQISLAKLASTMTFYLVVSLLTALFIIIFHNNFIKNEIFVNLEIVDIRGILVGAGFRVFLAYFLSGIVLYILAQFSQIISLFYYRFRGLIAIFVFILSNYLVFRAASILAPLLAWLPDIPIETFEYNNGLLNSVVFYLGSAPFIGVMIMLIALFLLASWILESQLEV